MDELVNALIQIYRGIAGPGMSTYMDAFPASSIHPVPTPPPMTGQVGVPSGSSSQPYVVPSGPHPTPISAPHMIPVAPPAEKKSKKGLIIAILAVLILGGGGAAAFVILSQPKDDPKPVAGDDHKGTDDKKGTDSTVVIDAATPEHVVDHLDAGDTHVDNPPLVADGGVAVVADAGVTAVATVQVLLMTKNGATFEAFEGTKKVLDGPDEIEITPGTPRTLVIKSKGYNNKTITVDIKDNLAVCNGVGCVGDKKKKKVTFGLDRVVIPNDHDHDHDHGSGLSHIGEPPPPKLDCKDKIVDPHDKRCRGQYCASHEDDVRCGAE